MRKGQKVDGVVLEETEKRVWVWYYLQSGAKTFRVLPRGVEREKEVAIVLLRKKRKNKAPLRLEVGWEWVDRMACLWYDFFRSLSHFTPATQATKINVLVKLRNLVGGRRID